MASKADLVSLQQVRYVCATLELGSFTAAAAALGVSQPAVAEQIRRLELLLGVDLFSRGGRGVQATEAGAAFAEHATAILRELEDGTAKIGELSSLHGGTVAIGVFEEPSVWRVDELVAAFLQRHPSLSVRLIGSNSSVVADHVRRGALEAGFIVLPVDEEGLQVRPIVRDEVLYVSADPARTREPATIERIVAAPLVFYSAGSSDRDPIRRQLAERAQALGARLVPKVEVEMKDIALRLVAAGIGDTYLPGAYTRAPYFPTGLTTTVFQPPVFDTFAVVTRPGRRLSPGVREILIDFEAHMRAVAEMFDRAR